MGAIPEIDGPARRLQGATASWLKAERLTELRRLAILDTPAGRVLRSDQQPRRPNPQVFPCVVISLVDESREWFKSRIGLQLTQVDREGSFADYVVRERRTLAVHNAALDARFADNPLVKSPPGIRGCLGVPLYSMSQQPIGALCAMDTRPRDFSADETAILGDFAAIVQEAMQTHASAAMQDQLLRLVDCREPASRIRTPDEIHHQQHSSPDRILEYRPDCEFANDAYRQLFGLTPEQMLGMHIRDVIGEELYRLNGPHARAALAGEPQRFHRRVMKRDGTEADTEGQYLPDVDEQGAVRGFFVLVTDVTELTAAKGELEISNAKLLQAEHY